MSWLSRDVAESSDRAATAEARSSVVAGGVVVGVFIVLGVLAWGIPPLLVPSTAGLALEYFPNHDFKNGTVVAPDGPVNHRWGKGAPAPKLPEDGFAGRWRGCIEVPASGMHLTVRTEGKARIKIDGKDQLRNWDRKARSRYEWNRSQLPVGVHPFEMEYRHDKGNASLYVGWGHGTGAHHPIPRNAFLQPGTKGCK